MNIIPIRFLAVLLISLASGVLALSVPVSVYAEPPATAVEAAPQQPALPLLSDIQALDAGYVYTCALTAGGGVKCWGWNNHGQLGDGTNTDRYTPVDVVGLNSGVQAIAAGYDHTCAVTEGGDARCWGNNISGQLGDGTDEDRMTPVDVTGLRSGVQAIAAGAAHTCVLTVDGGVQCWGSNEYGQLGNGTSMNSSTPVGVAGLSSGVQAIAAGYQHTCALSDDGGVKCWGYNGAGALGDGTTEISATPVDVAGLSGGAQAIAAGASHTCAVTADNAVRCWGANLSGQLGDGTTTHRLTPVPVSGLTGSVQALAADAGHTCALTTEGEVECWGENGRGQLGDGTTANRLTPVTVNQMQIGAQAIAAGAAHTCALTIERGVKCWGNNEYGQLGDGMTMHRLTPVAVAELNSEVQAITAGSLHTCALIDQGVKCWGLNARGQLGDGTTESHSEPMDVVGLTSGVQAISAGLFSTCALTVEGGVKCWGGNWGGQLGDGTTTDRFTPVQVNGLTSDVRAIAAGWLHTCALTIEGGVKCWGNNGAGQLGDGTTTDRLTPVQVNELTSGVQAIAAGWLHTCALTAENGVKCWGGNEFGQLGDGTTSGRSMPTDVAGLTGGVKAIETGDIHTCALTMEGGQIKCWGSSSQGQSGDGTTKTHSTPVDVVGLSNGAQAIAAGNFHTCALAEGGGVRCWGLNQDGQLGDGTTTDRWTPVAVSGLPDDIQALAGGSGHTCALTEGGGVRCWGRNVEGQLGVNSGWIPVDVVAGPTIRGRVLELDLDPIADAAVTYVAPTGQLTTLRTDAAGVFTFTVITTGMYTITVEKAPYSFFPDVMRYLVLSDQSMFQFIGALPPDNIPLIFLPSVKSRVVEGDSR